MGSATYTYKGVGMAGLVAENLIAFAKDGVLSMLVNKEVVKLKIRDLSD
ncbi:MAG: hypothetical protein H5T46_03455 [Archaeoglobi archaeon]|nr:hypothetical protein [Candidatus Mnemosynella sp.]